MKPSTYLSLMTTKVWYVYIMLNMPSTSDPLDIKSRMLPLWGNPCYVMVTVQSISYLIHLKSNNVNLWHLGKTDGQLSLVFYSLWNSYKTSWYENANMSKVIRHSHLDPAHTFLILSALGSRGQWTYCVYECKI